MRLSFCPISLKTELAVSPVLTFNLQKGEKLIIKVEKMLIIDLYY